MSNNIVEEKRLLQLGRRMGFCKAKLRYSGQNDDQLRRGEVEKERREESKKVARRENLKERI